MLSPLREGNLHQMSSREPGKFLSKKRGIEAKKREIDSYKEIIARIPKLIPDHGFKKEDSLSFRRRIV